MTVQRAIVLFPTFDAPEPIEAVRRAYDPLAGALAAHVTLVFPFAAASDAAILNDHLAASMVGIAPFDVDMATPTVEDGGYLFLRVTRGREQIVELHDRLYSGPLLPHLSVERRYEPHVTIGRLGSHEALRAAIDVARSRLLPPLRGHVGEVTLIELERGNVDVISTMSLGGAPVSASRPTRAAPNQRGS